MWRDVTWRDVTWRQQRDVTWRCNVTWCNVTVTYTGTPCNWTGGGGEAREGQRGDPLRPSLAISCWIKNSKRLLLFTWAYGKYKLYLFNLDLDSYSQILLELGWSMRGMRQTEYTTGEGGKLDGVATLVTDLARGYSTTKQTPHMCNQPLYDAIIWLGEIDPYW